MACLICLLPCISGEGDGMHREARTQLGSKIYREDEAATEQQIKRQLEIQENLKDLALRP